MKKVYFWLPRVLSILFILFISMFALDVFGERQWFLALIMHLIPSFILAVLTAVAWKNEKLGGVLFLGVGLLMFAFNNFRSLIVFAPMAVIGILFLSRGYFSKGKV